MLTLMILGAASMNAQVKIGGDPETEVTTGAVLELDGASGALLLPRVDVLPTAENSAAGMQVYLTTNNKVYTYDGSTWVAEASETQLTAQINANKQASIGSAASAGTADKLSQARRIILTGDVIGEGSFDGSGEVIIHTTTAIKTGGASIAVQPTAFSFTRLYDEYGDPGMLPVTGALNGPTLTVVANGANPTYKWQWRKSPATDWTDATATQGTGFNTASFTPKYTVGIDNWGLYEYQCIVSTADPSANVTSATAQVAAGCGAKTNATNGWLRFMCQNLGAATIPATNSLDNVAYVAEEGASSVIADGSKDAKGWLFQWGRSADGHQLRNSKMTDVQDQTSWSDNNSSAAKFVIGSGSWRANPTNADQPYDVIEPCPSGWRVPLQSDWESLYHVNLNGALNEALYNDWLVDAGARIQPKGSNTTTLFLPSGGWREVSDGSVGYLWRGGGYWSREAHDDKAYVLMFSKTEAGTRNWSNRAVGYSIRCVSL